MSEMTYARDPYDTDEPPCFCPVGSPDPRTTQEFCPAHGDPDKPAPEPRELCGSCDAGLPMSCTCPPTEHSVGDNCGLKGDDWYRAHGYLAAGRQERKL